MSELVWICPYCPVDKGWNAPSLTHCGDCGEIKPLVVSLQDAPVWLNETKPSVPKPVKSPVKRQKEASKKAEKKPAKAPKVSTLEWQFMALWQGSIFADPTPEFRFHPKRRWRFDFAWPADKIAVECEGGTWSGGRHTRGKGYASDCEKYNEAVLLGWKVLRFTKIDKDAIEKVETLFRQLEKMESVA